MDRRALIFGGAAALGFRGRAQAAEQIIGPNQHRVFVQTPPLVKQHCAQWCWAASSAMIFRSFGHEIDQEAIVTRIFGGLPCAPSGASPLGATGTITHVLGSEWVSNSGAHFTPHIIAAYDAFHGINAITNSFIVDALKNDKPILYCNTHHAMVVVAVDYFLMPDGTPNVMAVGVLDPWPFSPDFHPLNPAEMVPAHLGGQMTYLAAVQVG